LTYIPAPCGGSLDVRLHDRGEFSAIFAENSPRS
jgi:hypothetical protein